MSDYQVRQLVPYLEEAKLSSASPKVKVLIDALVKNHCLLIADGQVHKGLEKHNIFLTHLSEAWACILCFFVSRITAVNIASVVTVARLKYPPVVPSANFFKTSVLSDIDSRNTGHIWISMLKIKCSPGGQRRFWTSVTTFSDNRIIVSNDMTGGLGSKTDRTNVCWSIEMRWKTNRSE